VSIHTVPVLDERRHDLTIDCWCDPRIEWLDPNTERPWVSGLGPLVHHNAADCRECAEEVTDESIEPGKGWKHLDATVFHFPHQACSEMPTPAHPLRRRTMCVPIPINRVPKHFLDHGRDLR
jgi:hypothetical protein